MGEPYLSITFSSGKQIKVDVDTDSFDEIEVALERVQEGAGASFPFLGGRIVIPPGVLSFIEVCGDLLAGVDGEEYEADGLDFIE